jgi:hypothetical protein
MQKALGSMTTTTTTTITTKAKLTKRSTADDSNMEARLRVVKPLLGQPVNQPAPFLLENLLAMPFAHDAPGW